MADVELLTTCITFVLFTVSTGSTIFSVFYTHELSNNSTAASVPLVASTSSLFLLGVAAIALGHLASLASMPPLLGMLLAGLLLQNVGSFPDHFDFEPSAGTFFRKFAFLVILLRAGLGLDGNALKKLKATDVNTGEEMSEERCLKTIWDYFAQPFLFSLIGYQLILAHIDGSSVLFGVLVLLAGLALRMLASYVAVGGTALTTKERAFVAVAWLPKATVQAALAPVLMDLVAKDPTTYTFQREAQVVLTVAILSILLTAPAGACLIRALAPILIRKHKCDADEKETT